MNKAHLMRRSQDVTAAKTSQATKRQGVQFPTAYGQVAAEGDVALNLNIMRGGRKVGVNYMSTGHATADAGFR